MGVPGWKNVYDLSSDQIEKLGEAEEMMESMKINQAEEILMSLLKDDEDCIPVLNILGHLHGRYLSDFELAIDFYDQVLLLEPDNSWARDERRRYRRYVTYD
ncbi:MAG: hypothetical protein CMB66_04110 [Euryarchaeota archaeon]|nr:hypothetical protein [Euryarchaeota archaeon]|tara:strand:+ start:292 stop:597 length:306 start_codon:yes stop_codon:yes gene_type:complete